jgi:hypothetical protein
MSKPSAACVAALLMLAAQPAGAADAPAAPDPFADAKSEQALMKAQLENQKLALDNAEAARALTEAKNKAAVDAFPKGDTTGKVEAKDGAGEMEASALAAVATNAVANDIAMEVHAAALASAKGHASLSQESPCRALPSLKPTPAPADGAAAPVLLTNATDTLTFAQWERFRFRACAIAEDLDRTMAEAAKLKAKPATDGPKSEGGGSAAAISVALSVASKLAQLVTPDYQVASIKVTSTDRALMTAVARQYLRAGDGAPIYWPGQVSRLGASNDVFAALNALDDRDLKANKLLADLAPAVKAAQAKHDKVAENKKSTQAQKDAAKAELEKTTKPIAAVKESQAAYAALVKDLNGKEGEAALPIALVVQQAGMARLLGPTGLALTLNMQTAGGGYYTRRVIWNALDLNGPPYYISGGVVVNYAAIRAGDQQVYAAGLFSCDAGYHKVTKVAGKVNAGGSPSTLGCSQSPLTQTPSKGVAR